jgi:hypothetical protein
VGGSERADSKGVLAVLGGVESSEEHGGSARGVVVPLPWCNYLQLLENHRHSMTLAKAR